MADDHNPLMGVFYFIDLFFARRSRRGAKNIRSNGKKKKRERDRERKRESEQSMVINSGSNIAGLYFKKKKEGGR